MKTENWKPKTFEKTSDGRKVVQTLWFFILIKAWIGIMLSYMNVERL